MNGARRQVHSIVVLLAIVHPFYMILEQKGSERKGLLSVALAPERYHTANKGKTSTKIP